MTKCNAEYLNVSAAANNQLQGGYLYDAAGNMTHDATANLNYSYDQENRITGANGFTYTYDGDGNRVEKSNGSTGTLYWYMSPGIVAESDLSGNLQSEYVFFDGERVARKDFPSGAVSYYFSDHLKTTDIVTDAQGNIKNESDFYPWGGELEFTANDSNHYKFTGKERDSETGLDYFGARYYSNGLGRFITPDWGATPEPVPYADLHDPQSLNQYSYVRNLPTTKADADGHSPEWWQKLINKLSGDGWKTDAQVTEDHRQQMINDFSKRPDFQKDLKEMKPEQVNQLWDCLHSDACTQQMIANEKAAAAAAAAKSANVEVHHELPQEFRQQFERAGLDIEKYTKEMPRESHRLKPDGLHARGPTAGIRSGENSLRSILMQQNNKSSGNSIKCGLSSDKNEKIQS